ncbi:unnamed protein product [Ectocarpus sp. CCAP 1310/34]|nr:unnamed protein product [Ectocarpus sp. CCAP 1310/34]
MREEFSTLFPLCTHELALSTRPGAEAREKLTLQEKLASCAGIRTPDLTSRRFRGYRLDHQGDRLVGIDRVECWISTDIRRLAPRGPQVKRNQRQILFWKFNPPLPLRAMRDTTKNTNITIAFGCKRTTGFCATREIRAPLALRKPQP